MWQSIGVAFLVGLLFGNGIPHFVRGITKQDYPCMLGNTPTPNLIGGWLCFVAAGLLAHWGDWQGFHAASFGAASIGVLLIGLFHASIGAFGREG